jgi:hypothetical protein
MLYSLMKKACCLDIVAVGLEEVNQFSVLILPHAAISRVAATGQLRETTLHPEIIDGPILCGERACLFTSHML